MKSQNFLRATTLDPVVAFPLSPGFGELLWALKMSKLHAMVSVNDFAFAIFAAIFK
ncbi:MAG TPA: hypothetical protein VFO10_05015 [Oligoflexus sp.]|uniref:hypothetical protein n=1 Tax=Oligoflexus sp. TaxID=1971216 RepID=UPI002D810D9C|nr:hypothetical protein [Oligoflexus sp.]HET9236585.1 hypothetical protein [Oligoflexus sp.]